MRWYRQSTTANQKPTAMKVWDVNTGTVLYTLGTVPDNGATGWQAAAVPEVPVVLAGRQYRVTMDWTVGFNYTGMGWNSFAPPDFPAALWMPCQWYSNSNTIGYPANLDTGGIAAIDAQIQSVNRPLTWESVGSVAFDTEVKYVVPANRYVLTLANIPQWTQATMVGDVDVRRVVGFWLPIIQGSQGQQGKIDAAISTLALPGWTLMDGVVIQCYPGTTGTLEGFTVDDA